jgi:hypothetical protein
MRAVSGPGEHSLLIPSFLDLTTSGKRRPVSFVSNGLQQSRPSGMKPEELVAKGSGTTYKPSALRRTMLMTLIPFVRHLTVAISHNPYGGQG